MKVAKAPWSLEGCGVILVYKFPKKFVEENGHLLPFQALKYHGFLGTVMMVQYANSDVGPYNELLFVPGLFKFDQGKNFSISKIFVNSEASVWNGIENWGIPKEFADLTGTYVQGKFELEGQLSGKNFLEAQIKRKGFGFPLTTAVFPLKLLQKRREEWLLTRSNAKGRAYFAKVESLKIDQAVFPDVSQFKPLVSLVVENFKMVFNVPDLC